MSIMIVIVGGAVSDSLRSWDTEVWGGDQQCFMTFNLVLPVIMPCYLCYCDMYHCFTLILSLSRAAADTRQAGSLNLSISVEHLKINDSGGAVRERGERERERGRRVRERERKEGEGERERRRERNI